jgi:precorrin-6B methylase 2
VLAHIHLHAALEENPKKASTTNKHHQLKSSLKSQTALVQALKSLVKKLRIKNKTTHWSNYYADNTYTHEDFTRKKQFVLEAIDQVHPNTIWDFGANTGFFSLSVAPLVKNVISLEYDTNCVDTMYDRAIAKGTTNLLPLKQDLLNPSPAVGWGNCERQSLVQRGPCDLGMALAIIHHLALGGNVPLEMIAHSLAKMCKKLIIEFVHPEDIRASQLLERKPSLRERYSIQEFQKAFNLHFYVLKNISLNSRELYLLERH